MTVIHMPEARSWFISTPDAGYVTAATEQKPQEIIQSPQASTEIIGPIGISEIPTVIPEIQTRMQQAFQADPVFADRFREPLAKDEPNHDLLDRMDAGEFRGYDRPTPE